MAGNQLHPRDREVVLTHSAEETGRWGERFARRLEPGDTVALAGELGAGKTVLAQGICRGLGFEGEVTSPSFVRLHRYSSGRRLQSSSGRVAPHLIHHADFYLVESIEEASGLGLDELCGGEGIVIVEWAQKFPELIPQGSWWIDIEWGEGEFERSLKIR